MATGKRGDHPERDPADESAPPIEDVTASPLDPTRVARIDPRDPGISPEQMGASGFGESMLGRLLALSTGETVVSAHVPSAGEVGVMTRTPADESRYSIVGELGRGGMGVVLRCHDDDLDRDIAMKVMPPDLVADGDLVERFIEEAQIAGRLQHPGVAPVHELGIGSGRRPYFTMKLVEGRTLAELLHDRDRPDRDRARHLSIFLKVCQAMAYAHAQGIVHRDLKPANIMVGAFGEVHVMDWGLAKQLGGVKGEPIAPARSRQGATGSFDASEVRASLPGTVFGTPAYMPPEQARGEVHAIDQRSDVFSLGAVLCEVLTGKPPYTGARKRHAVHPEDAAELEPARARLGACGAHPELVALCLDCLQAEQERRPGDAGVVAERLQDHLAGVEERARVADLEAAAARARAVAERKARRATVALAVAVVTAILAGGGAFAWSRAQSQSALARQLNHAVATASELRGLAASAAGAPDEVARWQAARHAASQALALVGEESRTELEQQVTALATDIRAAADRAIARRNVLDRLEAVRLAHTETFDWKRHEADYAAAFAELGLDLDVLTPADAAQRIRESGIIEELLLALDAWAAARLWHSEEGWQRLAEIANRADDDGARRQLRAALLSEDADALADFAGALDLTSLPPASVDMLCLALFQRGHAPAAVEIYRDACRRIPDDFWLHHNLGMVLSSHQPPIATEALINFLVALAVRPRSAPTWIHAGAMRLERGDLEAALLSFETALSIQPGYSIALNDLGITYKRMGRPADAIHAYEQAIEANPDRPEAHLNLGILLQSEGDLEGAIAAYEGAVHVEPGNRDYRIALAQALEESGDLEGEIAQRRELVAQFPDDAQLLCQLGIALLNALRFDDAVQTLERGHRMGSAQPDWKQPSAAWLATAREARERSALLDRVLAGEDSVDDVDRMLDLAELARRRGRPLFALELFRQALAADPDLAGRPARWHWYQAACASARAAAGRDEETRGLDVDARDDMRRQALEWLQVELELAARLVSSQPELGSVVRKSLSAWLRERDLAPVRDHLDDRPAPEREACRALWDDVRLLIDEIGE